MTGTRIEQFFKNIIGGLLLLNLFVYIGGGQEVFLQYSPVLTFLIVLVVGAYAYVKKHKVPGIIMAVVGIAGIVYFIGDWFR